MKPNDRARLTTALRDHVGKIAADLRAKMRAPGDTRVRAQQLHADEKVAEDFDVWIDLLSRRAAVLWVLKSVYVRVLEDRGLLTPGRLLDQEAQQLFERLAPHLGETAFLRWVYRDLASSRGGLPELFSPQPAEVALPSDELSRALLAFWRHRDADTGSHWSFAEERFEGELMGDLYQELDPVVKDRFALCQTPDFVRTFILDRTLTPAVETFGADEVRLLDPACGSGHFLIDGLKRLVAATATKHLDWERGKAVAHALDRVVGVDLNDYACALARARLIMTAAELAGVTSLADAARFHPHVYWADGLEQVEREEQKPSLQLSLFGKVEEKPIATFTRSDVRAALTKVFATQFHAVVANPPYILEHDELRKSYHRAMIGRARRYVSATGKYSLAAPFAERCLQLACSNGFVGLIISNNFMRREFGQAFVEKVLSKTDLTLVADTSQAHIPFHGTPTVMIFARNRPPASSTVRAVMGKRSEEGTPLNPASGLVWTSIADNWNHPGFENEYVSVADVGRASLAAHPWNLSGGGRRDLKNLLDSRASSRLGSRLESCGIGAVTGADDIFVLDPGSAKRLRLNHVKTIILGDEVRNFSAHPEHVCVFPYDEAFELLPAQALETELRYLGRARAILRRRKRFGVPMLERGAVWYELQELYPQKYAGQFSVLFPNIASAVHFSLVRFNAIFNSTAQVMKLALNAKEDQYLEVVGLLNSAAACFWMKQVFHSKGSTAANRNHPDPSRAAYVFTATGLQSMPIPNLGEHRPSIVELARRLDAHAQDIADLFRTVAVQKAISEAKNSAALRSSLLSRWRKADAIREKMVALQEELDWVIYVAFELASPECLVPSTRYDELSCPRGSRPFERISGRVTMVRSGGRPLSHSEAEVPPVGVLPPSFERVWGVRERTIHASDEIRLMESPVFKRPWRDTEQNIPEGLYRSRKNQSDLSEWLAGVVENWASNRTRPFMVTQLVSAFLADTAVLRVAEAIAGRSDFSLDAVLTEILDSSTVPQHRFHTYTDAGLTKCAAWERSWTQQDAEDRGEKTPEPMCPTEFSQGSRGKSSDFVRAQYWRLRGPLNVPKERFVMFSEVPGRTPAGRLYGWAGWTGQQRVKAILAIDEELEDASIALADRIGLLDSAWRLLPEVGHEDAAAAARLKAELQALVGPEGPSLELIEDWRRRFPPPSARATRAKRTATAREEAESDNEETDES